MNNTSQSPGKGAIVSGEGAMHLPWGIPVVQGITASTARTVDQNRVESEGHHGQDETRSQERVKQILSLRNLLSLGPRPLLGYEKAPSRPGASQQARR